MKILMVLMSLEIGGAETHVVELSKELVRKGHSVEVVSKGGIYEKELTESGIPCYRLPLHSKNPGNLLESYSGLKKIIKKGRFDLVHAHARIPGFLCGLLQRRLKFRFITSAHWVFKTGPLLNLMTNWGEYSIAVSDDIKKYLIDNYKYPENRIAVTINGIDTEKFSPDTSGAEVVREFGMNEGKRRIVYVSRMDSDRSLAAFQIMDAAEELCKIYPDIEIVIVGGGNDYHRLTRRADEVNSKAGERIIITTGSRVDISSFIACGDIFVGVSRAALEAMAAAKPVVIAGNEGSIGIFGADKLDIAIKTNYCCRGCEQSSVQLITKDLSALLDMTKGQLEKMGEYNRQIIKDMYSAAKMAEDYEQAYRELLTQNPFRPDDVMISGYYGYGNIGDDSLLEAIIENLRAHKPDIGVTVLSATPQQTSESYGVSSIHRFNFLKVIRAMKRTKLLISGGGSLMQDVTSTKSIYYYMAIIRLAARYGMKIMVYANGIGPVQQPKNRQMCKKTMEFADVITLRESNSLKELQSLGLEKDNVFVTADPAFSLEPASERRIDEIYKKEGLSRAKDYFILSVREWKKLSPQFAPVLAKVCDHVSEKYGITPVLIPMQRSNDMEPCRKIAELATCKCEMLEGLYTAGDLLGLAKRCSFVIGMRLHILIYSLSVGTPAIGLSYDPKVDAVMSSYPMAFQNNVSDLDAAVILRQVDSLLSNRQDISGEILSISDKMRKNTDNDAQKAIAILNNTMV